MRLCRVLPERYAKANTGKHQKCDWHLNEDGKPDIES
jgi:hypothetical protein